MKTIRLLLVALAALATGFAVDTHFWQHGDRSDFESGTLKNLSLRADGRAGKIVAVTAQADDATGPGEYLRVAGFADAADGVATNTGESNAIDKTCDWRSYARRHCKFSAANFIGRR